MSVLVFVSRDFGLGRTSLARGVDRQSHTGLVFPNQLSPSLNGFSRNFATRRSFIGNTRSALFFNAPVKEIRRQNPIFQFFFCRALVQCITILRCHSATQTNLTLLQNSVKHSLSVPNWIGVGLKGEQW